MPLFRPDVIAAPPPVPLFDVHVHLGPSDAGDEATYPHLGGDEYLAAMDAGGIRHACAFAPLRESGYRTANRALADWAETTGGCVLPFARLGGTRVPLTQPHLWLLRRAIRKRLRPHPPDLGAPDDLRRFAGVKLLPPMDGVPEDDFFAVMRERRLPVLVHAGRYCPPRWIEKHLLPKTSGPLIIAHLGAFPNHPDLLRDALGVAARHERVYLDTSGVWVAGFLREAARRLPEKLVFGSDAPLAHPLVAWQHLASVVSDDDALERISHRTAHDLFSA